MKTYKWIIAAALIAALFTTGCNQPNSPGKTGGGESYSVGGRGPAGGWIFYIGDSFILEAAAEDGPTALPWSTVIDELGTTQTGIGTGDSNTEDIVSQANPLNPNGGVPYAAWYCYDYKVTVDGVLYDDWFLPSIEELELMYNRLQNRADPVGGFNTASGKYYVSSSENANPYGISTCYVLNFGDGTRHGNVSKTGSTDIVRPIRSFPTGR